MSNNQLSDTFLSGATLQTTPRSSRCMSTAWPVCSILVQTSARCSFGGLRSAARAAGHVRKIASLRSRAAPLGAALREELSLDERILGARSATVSAPRVVAGTTFN